MAGLSCRHPAETSETVESRKCDGEHLRKRRCRLCKANYYTREVAGTEAHEMFRAYQRERSKDNRRK